MKKHKMTVLLVGENQKAVKPRQISGNIVLNWKKYLTLFSIAIVLLVAVIGYLIKDRNNHLTAQSKLENKIEELHQSFEEIDTVALKEKFGNIDRELETINEYLKARGINKSIKLPQGGEESYEILSAEESADFYQEYLKKISYEFSHVPLGWPFKGTITSRFGHRLNPFSGKSVETHGGLDIRAPYGAPVKAMAKGTVVSAGKWGGYGNCIVIQHINGLQTIYGHLSKILVKQGQKVDINQQIGNVGSTGRSTGPHLHYEIRQNGKRVNPSSFLSLN